MRRRSQPSTRLMAGVRFAADRSDPGRAVRWRVATSAGFGLCVWQEPSGRGYVGRYVLATATGDYLASGSAPSVVKAAAEHAPEPEGF